MTQQYYIIYNLTKMETAEWAYGGYTLVHFDFIEIIRILRRFWTRKIFGKKPNIKYMKGKRYNQKGGIPNHHLFLDAVKTGDLESVIRLSQDVDPAIDDNYPIRKASREGHLPVVEYLATLPNVDPTANENEAIRLASWEGHLPVVKFLTTLPNVNPRARDNEAIILASSEGNLPVVEFLATLPNVDPTAKNDQAIRLASYRGHLPVVKFLTTLPNVDPTAMNNAAIRLASSEGHLPVVKFLTNLPNVDPTAMHNEAIRNASQKAYGPVIKSSLATLPNVDPTAGVNKAIKRAEYKDIVKFLLAIGDYSPDEIAKYLKLSTKETAKKAVEKAQYKYLLDQKALEMCMALKHLSLLQMITIIDASIKYAENIPFYVKWNFLEKCKHFRKK